MAIGTHLTAIDYLASANSNAAQGQKCRSEGQGELLRRQGFSRMVQAWLDEKDPDRLTAEDYLENPVLNKSVSPQFFVSQRLMTELRDSISPNPGTAHSQRLDVAQTDGTRGSKSPLETPVMEKIEKSIAEASEKYGVSHELIRAVIQAESGFKPTAVSSAGAQGLMQLMPMTARELGVEDPFDIDQNIDAGARYLRKMLDRFENNTEKALAAYNAGPGTVERYNGKVPYQETVQYVSRVLKFAGLRA